MNFSNILKPYNYKLSLDVIINLIIIFLIFGPAIPDLLCSLLALIATYYIFKTKELDENFYLLILTFLLLLLPNFFSPYFPEPFIEQLVNIRYFLFAFFICTYTNLNIDNIIKFLVIVTSILSFDLMFQFIFKYNVIGIPINPDHGMARASSFFRDELIAGTYILKFGLPIIGYYMYKQKNLLVFIFIILYELAIISSGERMSFILFGVGLFFLFIFNYTNFKIVILYSFSVLLVFAITLILFDEVRGRLNNFIYSAGLTEKSKFIDSGYGAHFQSAYYIYQENKLFGSGHKTFRLHCKKEKIRSKVISKSESCSTHPHNLYFEILSDSGLIGMFSFITFISFLLIKSIKSGLHKSKLNGFLVTFIIIIWPLSSAGNFFTNRIGVTNFLIIGIMLYFCKPSLNNLFFKNDLSKKNNMKPIK
jgi:O-antigen ligase